MRISTQGEEKLNKKEESNIAQGKVETPQMQNITLISKDKVDTIKKTFANDDSNDKVSALSDKGVKGGSAKKDTRPARKSAGGSAGSSAGGSAAGSVSDESSADDFLTKRFNRRKAYIQKQTQISKRKGAKKSIIAKKEDSDLSETLSIATKKKTENENKKTLFKNTAAFAKKESKDAVSGINFKKASQVSEAIQTPLAASKTTLPLKAAKKAGEKVQEKLKDVSKQLQQKAKQKQAEESQGSVQKVTNTIVQLAISIVAMLVAVLASVLGPLVMVIVMIVLIVVVIITIVVAIVWLVSVLFSWITIQEIDIDASTYSNLSYIYTFFSERDYGDTQIAAIMGNLYAELSSIDPTYDDGAVLGIMQWTGSNRTAIIEWCEENDYDVYTLKGQCEYMDQTFIEGTWNFASSYTGDAAYSSIYDITYEEWLVLEEDDIDIATGAFCACAERPYYYNSHLEDTRIPMAEYYLTLIQAGYFTTITSDIEYVQYALEMAYDDSIGYSQINRLRNPDVDCSSFVAFALQDAGYTITPSSFTTVSAARVLTGLGFEEITFSSKYNLLPGDILWRSGHMEIYVGDYLMVGAHTSTVNGVDYSEGGDQTGQEVSVTLVSEDWTKVYRLPVLSTDDD